MDRDAGDCTPSLTHARQTLPQLSPARASVKASHHTKWGPVFQVRKPRTVLAYGDTAREWSILATISMTTTDLSRPGWGRLPCHTGSSLAGGAGGGGAAVGGEVRLAARKPICAPKRMNSFSQGECTQIPDPLSTHGYVNSPE